MRRIQVQRKAASMVEFALVGPLTLMVLMSLIVGGMGMFRYQQVPGWLAKLLATPRFAVMIILMRRTNRQPCLPMSTRR
ncbi:MAG: TadE family protein [Gemmataceae bacterium]